MVLNVLYDAGCPFCQRCRDWVEGQPQLVHCRFVPMSSAAAHTLTGGQVPGLGRDLVVIADDGAFWAGSDAFVIVLWALEDHRALAMAAGHPWLRPFAAAFFDLVSSGRSLLSAIFGGGGRCDDGHCGAAGASSAYR